MRNYYTKGSEAAEVARYFEDPLRQMTDAAENACDAVEAMEGEIEEKDKEIEDLQKEVDNLESTVRDLQIRVEATNPGEMIKVLKNIILYCQTTLEKIQPPETENGEGEPTEKTA